MEKKPNKQNEAYFYNILDIIPASIYWKNKDGSYAGCNKYMLDMAGLNHLNDIIGKKDTDLPWKGIAKKLLEIDTHVINSKTTIEIEENPVLATNQEKFFLTTKAPLYNSTREVMGLVGVSIDITERKKYEAALKEAKEKAEVANKAKTEFLENMRHDIRTPLSGIIGFANILRDEIDDPKIKEYIQNLTASSDALLDLLNEILEVIKINAGEIPQLKKKFDLKKRLLNIIKLNQAKASYKHIDLLFEYDDNIPTYLIGDSTRIHRIALELVNNALNFTDKGHVKLKVDLAKTAEHSVVIRFTIADTGVGMPHDKQQEVFLQFKRLTPAYEGRYKGAGLGLAIVRQFLDELDGEIYLESHIGIGTQFTCLIPLKKALLNDAFGCEEIADVKSLNVPTSIPPRNKNYDSLNNRILVVEDSPIAAIVAQNILSKLNNHVDIAENGKKAIELTQSTDYDLIFMDIGLPDIDGYEVAKRIRLNELGKGTHTPIIALTAHTDNENKQRWIEAGINAILAKPLVKEKAQNILDAFIPNKKQPHNTEIPPKAESTNDSLQAQDKIIDSEAAKKILGNNAEILYEMLQLLDDSLIQETLDLQSAYANNDWPTISAIAHKIKGGCSYCGAIRLQKTCGQIEVSIKTNNTALAKELYITMLDEISLLKQAIKSKDY